MIPSKKYTDRLNKNDYKRPKKTMTEEYQNDELIQQKLKNYIEVPSDEIDFINIGSHLRYISFDPKTKKELFRFGGILVSRKKEYMILAGKEQKTFSVQRYIKDNKGKVVYTTRFFRLLKKEELLQEALDNTVDKSKEFLTKQNEIIQKQQKEIEELRSMMKKLGKK
jgi:hypothetical protein